MDPFVQIQQLVIARRGNGPTYNLGGCSVSTARHTRRMRILSRRSVWIQAFAAVFLVPGLATAVALGVGWIVARSSAGGSPGVEAPNTAAVFVLVAGLVYVLVLPLVVRLLLLPGRRLTPGVLALVTPLVFVNLAIAVHGLIPLLGARTSATTTALVLIAFETLVLARTFGLESMGAEPDTIVTE